MPCRWWAFVAHSQVLPNSIKHAYAYAHLILFPHFPLHPFYPAVKARVSPAQLPPSVRVRRVRRPPAPFPPSCLQLARYFLTRKGVNKGGRRKMVPPPVRLNYAKSTGAGRGGAGPSPAWIRGAGCCYMEVSKRKNSSLKISSPFP